MTWLFLRFYFGVLGVLLLSWFLYDYILRIRQSAEIINVISQAHRGGTLLVADELNQTSEADRPAKLESIQRKFDYRVQLLSVSELPAGVSSRVKTQGEVVCYRPPMSREVVATALANGKEVVQLGPFPDFMVEPIENSVAGWMRLLALELEDSERRDGELKRLRPQFAYPVEVMDRDKLPREQRDRIESGRDIAFYPRGIDQWYAATPIQGSDLVVNCGPFPKFSYEYKAASTTFGLVLFPVAFAIAILLRPVASQMRRIENAARAIAQGDLTARVDEKHIGSAQQLAIAFNQMAERTEKIVRTQRELLQAVSHELRTPLSRMRFAIDLIENTSNVEQRNERLKSLDLAAQELDDLVEELLRYVRIESMSPILQTEPLHLLDTIDLLVPKFNSLFPGLELRQEFPASAKEWVVQADRIGLQRVLWNLLSNAGRYAKKSVVIRCELRNEYVVIDIDDDGCGIPESERERVFEPFVRLDDDSDEHARGVGLGLALVKRIMAQHASNASIEQSPEGGCRVRTEWRVAK